MIFGGIGGGPGGYVAAIKAAQEGLKVSQNLKQSKLRAIEPEPFPGSRLRALKSEALSVALV